MRGATYPPPLDVRAGTTSLLIWQEELLPPPLKREPVHRAKYSWWITAINHPILKMQQYIHVDCATVHTCRLYTQLYIHVELGVNINIERLTMSYWTLYWNAYFINFISTTIHETSVTILKYNTCIRYSVHTLMANSKLVRTPHLSLGTIQNKNE